MYIFDIENGEIAGSKSINIGQERILTFEFDFAETTFADDDIFDLKLNTFFGSKNYSFTNDGKLKFVNIDFDFIQQETTSVSVAITKNGNSIFSDTITVTAEICGGGGGIDVSATTATAETVLAGYQFFNSNAVLTSGNLTIPESENMDFYKCNSVNVSELVYIVSGAGTDAVNGQYDNAGENIYSYTNESNNTTYYIGYNSDWGNQFITDIDPENWGQSDLWEIALYMQDDIEDPETGEYIKGWTVINGTSPAPAVSPALSQVQKTWTGYKAINTSGTYIFQSNATSLNYTKHAPIIGNIYNDNATVEIEKLPVAIPTDCVCYCPLNESANAAQTGQTYNITGEITYQQYQGINAGKFDGQSYIQISLANTLSNWTLSIWTCTPSGADNAVAWCRYGQGDPMLWTCNQNYNTMSWYYPDTQISGSIKQVWNHYAITHNNGKFIVYLNGNKANEISGSNSTLPGFYIGYRNSSQSPWNGYISAVRVYDRILNANEIYALSNEF